MFINLNVDNTSEKHIYLNWKTGCEEWKYCYENGLFSWRKSWIENQNLNRSTCESFGPTIINTKYEHVNNLSGTEP